MCLGMLLPTLAVAADIEQELYQSCLAADSSSSGDLNQSMCSCQARKWAAGRVESFNEPKVYLNIKNNYIEKLKENWNHDIRINYPAASRRGIESK